MSSNATSQIVLTPSAADKVRRLMEEPSNEGATGLRVRVAGGGCSGLTYQLKLERSPEEADQILESEGVQIFLDPKSALFVTGTQINWVESMMGSGFEFQNPNAKGTCGCGTSFTA